MSLPDYLELNQSQTFSKWLTKLGNIRKFMNDASCLTGKLKRRTCMKRGKI